jgi:bifunctional non-homologous end joining protein LigD
VLIWDRGTYTAERAREHGGDQEAAVRAGLEAGEFKFKLNGKRLKGSFVLVRTRVTRGKAQWLLIKHRDDYAQPGSDVVAENDTSVVSKRTMEDIAADADSVWHSNREAAHKKTATRSKRAIGERARMQLQEAVLPMLAGVGKELPAGNDWTYEPKYDGIRVLAYVTASDVRLVTRNRKDKTAQFPEIVAELEKLPGKTGRALVLDGEIVALQDGEPARFQELQGRMHVENERAIQRLAKESPAALIVFDLLADGADVLLQEPWSKRRARLEKRLARRRLKYVRLGTTSTDAVTMLKDAQAHGWEGLLAKRIAAPYRAGQRSRDWLKLKIEQRQEFVVGGYTEPRNTREHLGALLLGYYDHKGDLIYAGHTGTGFTRKSLGDVYRELSVHSRKTAPFVSTPRTNEKAHWVDPRLVVEVRFNEWTRDGRLRQPVFVGVRDDKDPGDVRRENGG